MWGPASGRIDLWNKDTLAPSLPPCRQRRRLVSRSIEFEKDSLSGREMKRMLLAVLGIAWGLFVTWASIYAANHIHWPEVKSRATGCNDLEHCAPHARFVAELLASLLWPAIAFGVLNVVAYRRWSGRRWSIAFGVATLLAILFYVAPYALPASGLVRG
ncbi:hypothetical protein [Burkholderia multivorans]|uniref:hypothetical protein n=1 Tax=Burkholderia multivorans TaxID=87883 RepID=UPI003593B094